MASNWETPRGSYSQICLTKKWSVTIKPIVLHSQFLSFATKEQNNTPRNKVNLIIFFASLQWPDEEVESDGIDCEVLGKQFASAVQGEPPARLEGLR